jgi:DNA polymerase-3 subunit alpha
MAVDLGHKTLALTDINNTSGCLDFVRLATKKKLKPVLGIDFRNGADQVYVGLAKSNKGFKELNTWLSEHLHAKKEFALRAPVFKNAIVVYPYRNYSGFTLLPHEFVGIKSTDLIPLSLDKRPIASGKLLCLESATFRNKKDFNTHRLLRAIANNCLLSQLPKSEEAFADDLYRSAPEVKARFAALPQVLENTQAILNSCSINFIFNDVAQNHNQSSYSNSKALDFRLMRKICLSNLAYRYPNPNSTVLNRMEKELAIIKEKNFVSYFLINWKIVKYARSKGFYYIGRGSGANSIVAYLMRITDVDPIELDLYFERFINLYRQNPPDFDIDFSWTDREDITRFIFTRFKHTALLGTYVTFKYKAAVREIGKVFGLPDGDLATLASGNYALQNLDEINRLVVNYAQRIVGMPNHLSIHAGGILIANRPIHHFSATYMPPKGFPTVQFDMVTAEDVGLFKFDILSQRGLGKIKDSLKIIAYNQPNVPPIDIHDFHSLKVDKKVNNLLCTGQAIGCFYVESPAMRMLMQKMRVNNYLGLVAASSVIRPGVAKSGMMRTFVERYRNPQKRKEANPILLEIMPETFGVMVYQEDVIKVAHYFAGLDLGEADVLRRGMSGKYRGRQEFEKARLKFFSNCQKKGYTHELTTEIWRQTESFAGYAFAKGHSASYAVESYQSLYLKAYFPLEYMVATLNNGGGFYSREHYLHEARMQGGQIEAPCVNHSYAGAFIEAKVIYLGLAMINGLESKLIDALTEERNQNGVFTSLDDFVERVAVSLEQITLLIKVGGFRFSEKEKKHLLWRAYALLGHHKKSKPQATLFSQAPKSYKLPPLSHDKYEDAFHEYELLGFPLCNPFELLTQAVAPGVLAKDLPQHIGKQIETVGYLVSIKNTKTSRNRIMQFGNLVDCEGNYLDTVHFPNEQNSHFFKGRGIYRVKGRVAQEYGHYSIEVLAMEKLAIIPDPRYAENAHTQVANEPLGVKAHASSRADFIKRKKNNNHVRR